MRLALSLVLALLAAAMPAAAQTKLAQQCAAFGEAQYRKLSPSVAARRRHFPKLRLGRNE